MGFLKRLLPVASWLPNYQKNQLRGDFFAGLTVGVMLIPQGMAYALIAGLPPVYGLYASIVPQVIYVFLGTSRKLSVGPVAMDSLLVAAGVGMLAEQGSEAYLAYAIFLAFLIGLIQLLLGILRLGFISNLLSKPVISGFTSAAAVIIGFGQLKYLLGVDIERSNQIQTLIKSTITTLDETHLLTLFIGVGGILVIKGIRKIHPALPGSLAAVVIGILLVHFFNWHQSGVAIVGDIPKGLPDFQVSEITFIGIIELTPLALTIAIIGFMEAFSVGKALESKGKGQKLRPNQELIALGAANAVGSFFQSFPVTGGFSRSAVNYQSGANTQLASWVSAGLVGLTLLYFTPLFYYLPQAILASVIMMAVSGLIDVAYAKQLWKDSKIEFVLLLITFILTIGYHLIAGIVAGIVLSILVLLYRSAYPHVARLGRVKGHHEFRNIKRFSNLETWENILILRIDAPLTFINIQYFKDYAENALEASKAKIHTLILDGGPMSYLDATAAAGLRELAENLHDQRVNLLMCDLIGPVRDTLHKTGLMKILGEETIFLDVNEAVRFATTNRKGRFKKYALQHEEES